MFFRNVRNTHVKTNLCQANQIWAQVCKRFIRFHSASLVNDVQYFRSFLKVLQDFSRK